MKRLLPAPLLSAALFALWLLLNESSSPGQLLLAAILAIAVPLLTAPLRPHAGAGAAAARAAAADRSRSATTSCSSNLQVASRRAARSRARRAARSCACRSSCAIANALAALAMITTVVPGTVWSELAADRSALLLHVFDVDDEAAFVAHFKARYERPLMEIFE